MIQRLEPRIGSLALQLGPSATMGAACARSSHPRPLNLAMGEPGDAPPEAATEAAVRVLRDGGARYGPAAGQPELVELLCEDQARKSGICRGPGEVLVTAGGKPALIDGLRCLLEPGDEVLVLAPYWPSFLQQIQWAGGVPRIVPCGADLRPDLAALSAAVGPRTRVLIVNDPSNPTSLVLEAREQRTIARLAERHSLWIVADQVYDDLLFEGASRRPLLATAPELCARTLVVESFSKRFAMTGQRLGMAYGPAALIAAMTRLGAASVTCANTAAQAAGVAALRGGEMWGASQRARYRARRDRAVAALSALPWCEVHCPPAGFYLFPRLLGAAADDLRTVERLRDELGVLTVPGTAFGAPGHLRLAYGVDDGTLDRALARLGNFMP